MNGIKLLDRAMSVDHVLRYRKPRKYTKEINENKYGDISEDDKTYDERRREIWDYKKYQQSAMVDESLHAKAKNVENEKETKVKRNGRNMSKKQKRKHKHRHKIRKKSNVIVEEAKDLNENNVSFDIQSFLKKKLEKENAEKLINDKLEKEIELRRLKRNLMRKLQKGKLQNSFFVDDNGLLKDKNGNLIDLEQELNKQKKHLEFKEMQVKMQREMQYKLMMRNKKNKALENQSKSVLLDNSLKCLYKEMKNKKKRKRKRKRIGIERESNGELLLDAELYLNPKKKFKS